MNKYFDCNAVFTTDFLQFYFTANYSLNFVRSIPITINEPVNKITFSSDSEYLYALSSTHVSMLLVCYLDYLLFQVFTVNANLGCSSATSCSECLSFTRLVCGWCQLDFTCTANDTLCTVGKWLRVSGTSL